MLQKNIGKKSVFIFISIFLTALIIFGLFTVGGTEHRTKVYVLSMLLVLLNIYLIKNLEILKDMIKEIIWSKSLIMSLAVNDFKTRFAGSYFGVLWAFVQPMVTIAVYWFVFQVGFRSGTVDDFPFVLWLATGLIPWFFVSEAWNSGTVALIDYSYLVKKVVFKISILPLVKIVSAFFVHVFFVCFIIFLYLICGFAPHLAWIQVVYYSLCIFALVTGLSYCSSALMVFFRDTAQIIAVFLQVFIWITPIMWSYTMLGEYSWLAKYNPLFYIVQGYRDAMINGIWFWNKPFQTVAFWIFTIGLLALGMKFFNKSRIHFADVL